jgi:hypothetical protein
MTNNLSLSLSKLLKTFNVDYDIMFVVLKYNM